MRKRYKTELMNCFHKTFKPTFLGRLYFFAFFPINFKKSVDDIVQKCYNNNCKGDTPLTKMKGVKYEKIGKKKATQNEAKTKFQNQTQLVYLLLRVDD